MRTLILLLSLFTFSAAQVVGSTAKPFTLYTVAGKSVSLSDHSGKVIYINWFGNTCPTCLQEGNDTQTKIADRYKDQNFVALGIDVWDGSANSVQNFINQTGIRYDCLLNGGSTASDYGVQYQKSTVIDQQGVIQFYDRTNKISAINSTIDGLLSTTGLEKKGAAVSSFELKANYPNPFNPKTEIPFSNDREQNIRLRIYDINGRLIRTLVAARFAPGNYSLSWYGKDDRGKAMGSGVYFVRLEGEQTQRMRRILLLK